MKKIIILEEGELEEKMFKFCEKIEDLSNKGYGFHLVSNETGKRIEDKNELLGTILLVWNAVFKS